MKKVYVALFLVMIMLLTSCSLQIVKSKLDNSINVLSDDGTEFTIRRIEDNIPDQEITIIVSVKGEEIFCCYDMANHLDEYEYSNDIVENYGEIINEYYKDEIKVYQFYWGVIYTFDDSETFLGVAKHNYKKESVINDEFRLIMNFISNDK